MTYSKAEDKIRRLKMGQIKALKVFVESPSGVTTTTTISGMLSKQNQDLGGTISSLARVNIEGESLIVPMGKSDNQGMVWKLNEKVIDKNKLTEIVIEIESAKKLI